MKKKKSDTPEPQAAPVEPVEAVEEPVVELTPEEALAAERDDLLDRLQRVSAEFMNFQKRTQREREDQAAFAKGDILKAMLPVLDDMERALDAARENHGEDAPFYSGIGMVHTHMLDVLRRFGCSVMETVGEGFNPDRHAAMMQQPTEDHEPNTVIHEAQRGYELNGRTLRPAGVIVSVAPADPDETPSEDDAETEEQE